MNQRPEALFDPVTLEILWSRLIAVAEEQSATVRRTAFSNVVRESHDYTCVVTTRTGQLLAQPTRSMPGFVRCVSTVMQHFLKLWPEWHPGDVAITNDPWLAAGHLNDIALAVPVFHKGKLVGFSANIAHQADIGGRGYSADANSIFEEGLALPPMKLYRADKPVAEVLSIIRENVRVPDQVIGDITAQITAARLGAQRLDELMTEAGLVDLDQLSEAVVSRSEQAIRSAITQLPDGVYENEGVMDGYDDPLRIRVKLTVRGDEVELDFTGTSPQVNKGINSCYNFSYGYSAYAIKAALDPNTPNNDGSFRPISMIAPEGSIVASKRPAPGNSRGRIGHMLVPVVFGALTHAMPGKIMAEAGSPAPRVNFFGEGADGKEFQCLVITCGGLGAQAGLDGASCKAFPTNTSLASLEVMETIAPLRFLKRELVPDSGGAGCTRGGLGQEITLQVLGPGPVYVSTSADRIKNPPRGFHGGLDGLPVALSKNDGEYLAPKARSQLRAGDIVTIRTPGGGGYGLPSERPLAAIQADLAEGLTTDAESRRHFPVYRQWAEKQTGA